MSSERGLLFGIDECGATTEYSSRRQRQFLEHLHECSTRDGWFGDGWYWGKATIVTITRCNPTSGAVDSTLRVDLFDDRVVVGYDTTHQLTDDLDESRADVHVLFGDEPAVLADFAARKVRFELEKNSASQ